MRGLGGHSVTFLGHVPDMRQLLSQVDAVALPSRYPEGIPRILIEAAACGVVPIASDFPGSRALIEDDNSGIILREPLAQSLASEVRRLASNKPFRERLGAGARRRVETGGFDERMIAEHPAAVTFVRSLQQRQAQLAEFATSVARFTGASPAGPIPFYVIADPDYVGRATVPVLWDRRRETIVNNESGDIIRMFDAWPDAKGPQFRPPKRASARRRTYSEPEASRTRRARG